MKFLPGRAWPFETALVDVTNPNILEPHLACAAYELALEELQVGEVFGPEAEPVARRWRPMAGWH